MNQKYNVYLVSDSTGETLDRIFLALKAQFKNFDYKIHPYSFTRTENQILKIELQGKFTTERGRINCSINAGNGFWRWLGMQFVIAEN